MNKPVMKAAYITAMAVWAILCYSLLFEYLKDGVLFARSIDKKPYTNDFVNTYGASLLARQCLERPTPIYDPQVQQAVLNKLVAPVVPDKPFYFQYPPYYFLVTLPLALVPMPLAWVIWTSFWFALCFWAIDSQLHDLPPVTRSSLLTLIFASYPFWLSAELGQTSLIVLPLLVWFFNCLRTRSFVKAGIAVGLMSIKLQYLPAFGIMGLIAGRGKFLIGCLVTLAALLALAAAVLGWPNIMHYPEALAIGETGRYFTGVNPFAMQNVRGELWLIFHNEFHGSRLVSVAVGVLALLILAVLWMRRWRADMSETAFARLGSYSILIALMTSLHAHIQDYVFSALPCIWLWRAFEAHPDGKPRKTLLGLLQSYPALSWLFLFFAPIVALIFIQPYFFWAACLLMAIIIDEKHDADQGDSQHNEAHH